MTTTSKFQVDPDYYLSEKECIDSLKNKKQTNSRYKNFNQTVWTAGDEEQFQQYRDMMNFSLSNDSIDINDNLFRNNNIEIWDGYKNIDGSIVTDTFRYIFNKFKKGLYIKIIDNKVKVFMPFSKANYTNEWHDKIKIHPSYKDFNDFLKYISESEGRHFNNKNINKFSNTWYANNFLLRYEYPIVENDTNICIIKNMFEQK
jgi:hypothetical protein